MSSFSFDFTFLDDHVACWIITDLNLPGSSVDEIRSKGFVKYHIDHLEAEHLLSEVKNHAHIHFNYSIEKDYTFADLYHLDHYDYDKVESKNELGISVFLNRSGHEIDIITSRKCREEQLTVEIFDEDGIVEFIGKLNNENHILLDTSFLHSGSHTLSVYDNHHHESLAYFIQE